MQPIQPLVFKPRRPHTGRSWLLFGIFMAPYTLITILLWYISLLVFIPWTVVLVPCLFVVVLLLFFSARGVDYTLEADALVLRYGTLVNYRLPYRTISDVRHYTLTSTERPTMRGTWAKLPSLDTTAYRTSDVGDVKMLATTSSGPIVLIETESGNYGINPIDDEGFISALRQRVRWDGDDSILLGDAPEESTHREDSVWLGDVDEDHGAAPQ